MLPKLPNQLKELKRKRKKKNNPENKCKTIEKRKIEQLGTIKLDGR